MLRGVPRGVFIHPASCNPHVQSMGSAPPPLSFPWFERSLGLLLGAVLCLGGLIVELFILGNGCTYIHVWPDACWQNWLSWGLQKNFLVYWLLDEIVATDCGNYEKTVLNILFLPFVVHNNSICILILQQYPKRSLCNKDINKMS